MAKEIELPDGSIGEFPDDMSDDAIRGVLSKKFPAPAPHPKAGPYQPYQNEADIGSDTERFGENPGTGKGGAEFHQGIASTPARLVKSLAQMTGQGDKVPEVVNKSAQVADTGFGTAGRVVGDIAATAIPAAKIAKVVAPLPLRARVAAVMAENAGYGAALSPDEQGGAALTGAVAGPLGMALGRTAGGLVRPTAEARTLMDRGVSLTPGQAAGVGASNMGFDTLGAGMLAAGALGSRPGTRMMTGGYSWQPAAEAAIRHLRRGVPAATRNDDQP
jgi:hypothetical protein